ncbi:UNVERIFIED_CONTAM: hypothetical protein Sradi_5884000 [Sesamum radiatum]|uniref:DUF4283 domain-containing protein n=1 Tax=Sesamum radiatum TaxID=300843 RepID=A0AAW2KS17_SESRA
MVDIPLRSETGNGASTGVADLPANLGDSLPIAMRWSGNSHMEHLNIEIYITSLSDLESKDSQCGFSNTPAFTSEQESSIVLVWVCFPKLSAHLFHKNALFAVASVMGTPLQIDDFTFNQFELSKARVGIEIDLTKPLVEESDLKINGITIRQKVEYEQVPKYCNICKHVRHDNMECYSKGKEKMAIDECVFIHRYDFVEILPEDVENNVDVHLSEVEDPNIRNVALDDENAGRKCGFSEVFYDLHVSELDKE